MKKKSLILAGVLLLAGCGSPSFEGRPGLTFLTQSELPPPTRADQILQKRSYLIGPSDKVNIEVYGVPELTRTVQVDASGTIGLPFLGVIEAAGKTPAELAVDIRNGLAGRYVRDPQVTVNADTVNQTLAIDGEVEKPGLYPVVGRMTLMRAVAQAEGFSQYADASYVVVFRQVDNKQMAALYDLGAIQRGRYEDPEIFPNDVIQVGESSARRLFSTIVSSSALLVGPIIALIQR